LISSSTVAKDFYAGFIKKDITDKRLTLLMRFSSVVIVVLSIILAYYRPSTIVSILGISWGAIGAVFLGPFLWGLFSKRMNKFGAITSSVIGLAVCIIMYARGTASPEAGTIGMIVSLTLNPIISYLTPAPTTKGYN
jgi:Na+/proline symporter